MERTSEYLEWASSTRWRKNTIEKCPYKILWHCIMSFYGHYRVKLLEKYVQVFSPFATIRNSSLGRVSMKWEECWCVRKWYFAEGLTLIHTRTQTRAKYAVVRRFCIKFVFKHKFFMLKRRRINVSMCMCVSVITVVLLCGANVHKCFLLCEFMLRVFVVDLC